MDRIGRRTQEAGVSPGTPEDSGGGLSEGEVGRRPGGRRGGQAAMSGANGLTR